MQLTTLFGYVSILALTAAVCAGLAVWARRTDSGVVDGSARRYFGLLLGVNTAWAATTAVTLLLPLGTVRIALVHIQDLLALGALLLWVLFTRAYTGRSTGPRSPPVVAAMIGAVALGIGVATNPIHGLAWTPIPHTSPFVFVEMARGPIGGGIIAYSGVAAAAGIYYLLDEFLTTRYRPAAAGTVVVSGVAAYVPTALSTVGLVPVREFSYSAFGILPFALGMAIATYRFGLFDVERLAQETLFRDIGDPSIVVDTDRRVVDFNRAAADLFPELDAEARGEPFEAVCPAVTDAMSIPATSTDGGVRPDEPEAAEVTIESDRGVEHYSAGVSSVTAGGRQAGYAVLFRDVTDIVGYREELERQNEQLDAFASAVGHDLRNPINVARGYLQAVDGEIEDEAVAADIDEVRSVVGRMDQIVDDLRTLAKHGQTVEQVERVGLDAVAKDAWGTVETGDATLDADTGAVLDADRSRLRSILENLVRNAVDHVGPEVTVTVEATDDRIVVADDGPGIDEATADRALEYGYTTSNEGTGLGLAIVETMAEAHGWTVEIVPDTGGFRLVVSEVTSLETSDARTGI
ncbi:hypothetical protein BRD17_03455 [Halobacteriales archaeon SW_7_68_16]|nr:MAG: hypothetical protein BRD17_03455 [Halobacteriales archaeon SW_7_68_16]